MATYYSPELLDEMREEATEATERLAVFCGTITYNNMLHLGKSEYTLEQCIEAYRKGFERKYE